MRNAGKGQGGLGGGTNKRKKTPKKKKLRI